MEKDGYVLTSESVTEGHPDKLCDQISDAVLDAIMANDPNGRVACETSVTTGLVLVFGEITTSTYINIPELVRKTILHAGYNNAELGFDGDSCGVIVSIDNQSPDIAQGVNTALESRANGLTNQEVGAGDQGMMIGYAVRETPELMPMPISLAHRTAKQLALVRKSGTVRYLRPDGKTQITVEYNRKHQPIRIDTIVVSTQHGPEADNETIERDIVKEVITPIVPKELIDSKTRIIVNPSGRFVIGGPHGDAGLTGRKIIVDTYGGSARHGGGAFSGKDPTKVDRSGAYAARWVAKNLVAAGIAQKLELQISYAIGVAKPISIAVETFGTGVMPAHEIANLVQKHFDLRPRAIIEQMDLRRPIFQPTATYGHFGREDLDVPWERLNMTKQLERDIS